MIATLVHNLIKPLNERVNEIEDKAHRDLENRVRDLESKMEEVRIKI